MSFQPKNDVWLISDTHFNHANILKFDDGRGDDFLSVDYMNKVMYERWNDSVKPGDIVYHLGDVFMGDREWFSKFWPKLHGRKRLIVGNHDDIKFLSRGSFFQKVQMWRIIPEYGVVLTHVPIVLGEDHPKYKYNIHGHTHRYIVPDSRYLNVCVENTDYAPIKLEDVIQKLKVVNG